MKKRIITILSFISLVGVCVWRFCPLSFSDITISKKQNLVIYDVSYRYTEVGNSYTYRLNTEQINEEFTKDILEILNSSSYRPDFRNLWPFGLNQINSDKNYDGNSILMIMGVETEEEWLNFHYISSSLVSVSGDKFKGILIYHPTNYETKDKLIEYIKENGVKQ